MRTGRFNGNWKGGLSRVKLADEVLTLSDAAQRVIKKRILDSARKSPATGCWNWIGKVFQKSSRAMLNLGGNLLAYRVSYVLWKGPTNGLCVLHTCDNVICVNPEHLWLGTNADNSADMVAKGRQAVGDANGSRKYPERLVRGECHLNHIHPERVQGENNGRALLTADQVREIRAKYRPYVNNHKPSNQRQLAEEYGVNQWVVAAIVKGQTWKSVK